MRDKTTPGKGGSETAPQAQKIIKAWAVVCDSGQMHGTGAFRNKSDALWLVNVVFPKRTIPPACGPHRVVLLTGKVVKR